MSDEVKLLLSRADDLIESVKSRTVVFSRFLSEEELAAVMPGFLKCGYECKAYGGCGNAQRQMVCLSDAGAVQNDWFPLTTICFDTSKNYTAGHRDVLGALMSLGIKRELLGDIIFEGERCFFFADSSIAQYILQNFDSVGKCRIQPKIYTGLIEYNRQFIQSQLIVASLRLDCIVGAVYPCSRTKAEELIAGGLVLINGIQVLKKDKTVVPGEVLTVRKKGKYRVDGITGNTKKDRIKLQISKYN